MQGEDRRDRALAHGRGQTLNRADVPFPSVTVHAALRIDHAASRRPLLGSLGLDRLLDAPFFVDVVV